MLYAAYGSNLHPVRLTARISSAQLVGTACLPNWSLRFHKRSEDESGKCSIVPGDSGVHFAIFDISAGDKVVLDAIEGVGSGYAEISLEVPGIGNCVSYVAEETYIDDTRQPYDWYKALVVAGVRYHGFPDHYLLMIESVVARRDPDPARRVIQWELVERVMGVPIWNDS